MAGAGGGARQNKIFMAGTAQTLFATVEGHEQEWD